jgi:purine-binding chemotaxis protein CheW
MENQQYLTFSSHNLRYGIEATLVQEILPIPELTPIIETGTDVIGMINLRKQIVSVMQLNLNKEPLLKDCKVSDYIIILRWEDLLIGLVVQQLNEVLTLNQAEINTEPAFGLTDDIITDFVAGVAQIDSGKIILLNLQALMRQLDDVLPLIWDAQMQLDIVDISPVNEVGQQVEQELEEVQTAQINSTFFDLYSPDSTSEERTIFRQRADNLKSSTENLNNTSELISLAVISLGNEYFGLDLGLVKEFANIRDFTPIPCCPNHIVGNMNLRGEVVTLVDIRNILNLPTVPVSLGTQTVVVEVDDIIAGIPVERVLEMAYLNSADLIPPSESLPNVGEKYIQGSAFFQGKMLKIVDLTKLFIQGDLTVNEEV